MNPARATLILLLASLGLWPLAFGLASWLGPEHASQWVTRLAFVATLALEGLAFSLSLVVRARFRPGEPNRRIWNLFVAFLAVRLLAQLRLFSLYFGLVPAALEDSPGPYLFYTAGLRYLYTLSDLLFAGTLVLTLRAWRATGLPFATLRRDWLMMLGVCLLPLATYALAGNLTVLSPEFQNLEAGHLQVFRLVAVSLGSAVACLCLVVRRYALQMGGGALAGAWNAVVVAGIAHAASFLALGLLGRRWNEGAEFLEQLCLWLFAGALLLAVLRQRALTLVRRD